MPMHVLASVLVVTSPVAADPVLPEGLGAASPVILADAAVAQAPVEPTVAASPADASPEATSEDAPPPVEDDPNIITVEGITEAPPGDPLYKVNEASYEVVQEIDDAIVDPIATGYEKGLPEPVRDGLSNFFQNLREPIVFLNFLLQGKPGKAFETLGRFTINTTIGVAGLVDVAKKDPFNLPHRRNGFANTLGFYGVKPGAFLYLPLVGPTTIRDGIGGLLDTAFLPAAVGKPFNTPYYAVSSYTVRSLDERIQFDDRNRAIEDSDYPYAAMRATYLCERQREIDALRNRPPSECEPEAVQMMSEADKAAVEAAVPPAEGRAPEAAPAPSTVDPVAPVAPLPETAD